MYDDSAMIMILNTLTSTHPGSGTELSFVDMPIQREGHTGYPKIEAATLKGCMRYSISQNHKDKTDKINRIFGKPDHGDFASATSITDARLLFFPVKSVKGIFGWITCPMVMERFFGDYQLAIGKRFMETPPTGVGLVSTQSQLVQMIGGQDTIMLEDYTYKVTRDSGFEELLEHIKRLLPEGSLTQNWMKDHAVLLSDDDFASFVKHSTEVSTRIKIDSDTGTVVGGALFSEEFLPPECVFYSLIFFTKSHVPQENSSGMVSSDKNQVKAEFLELFTKKVIQIGADSTLGKGLVQVNLWEEK